MPCVIVALLAAEQGNGNVNIDRADGEFLADELWFRRTSVALGSPPARCIGSLVWPQGLRYANRDRMQGLWNHRALDAAGVPDTESTPDTSQADSEDQRIADRKQGFWLSGRRLNRLARPLLGLHAATWRHQLRDQSSILRVCR